MDYNFDSVNLKADNLKLKEEEHALKKGHISMRDKIIFGVLGSSLFIAIITIIILVT